MQGMPEFHFDIVRKTLTVSRQKWQNLTCSQCDFTIFLADFFSNLQYCYYFHGIAVLKTSKSKLKDAIEDTLKRLRLHTRQQSWPAGLSEIVNTEEHESDGSRPSSTPPRCGKRECEITESDTRVRASKSSATHKGHGIGPEQLYGAHRSPTREKARPQ